MGWLKILLYSALLLAIGFFSGAALEYDEVAKFLSENTRWFAIGTVSFLLFVILIILIFFWILPKWMSWKFGIAFDQMTDETMVARVFDRVFLGDKAGRELTFAEQQRIAMLRLAMWFMRREAVRIYFSMLVAIGGGAIGTATVYLLFHQNEKLTLQTDATIVQTLLLEGSRRAQIQNELTILLEDIEAEVSTASQLENKTECIASTISGCWAKVKKHNIYRMSASLHSRVSAFLNASTPYHILSSASPSPTFDELLRKQVTLDFVSPERSRVLKTLSQLRVSGLQLNFANTSLAAASLVRMDLQRAILDQADMRIAYLQGANLLQTRLQEANLLMAQMREANLQHADLRGATLQGADLLRANLKQANLEGANLRAASLREASLQGTNLDYAVLQDADLQGADLRGASLSQADLQRAVLQGVDLQWAKLEGANLQAANLRWANLNSTDLLGAILQEADLQGAWAWSDTPPKLPNGIKIQLCHFDEIEHERALKPEGCIE